MNHPGCGVSLLFVDFLEKGRFFRLFGVLPHAFVLKRLDFGRGSEGQKKVSAAQNL